MPHHQAPDLLIRQRLKRRRHLRRALAGLGVVKSGLQAGNLGAE
jgi:hypothetical protein